MSCHRIFAMGITAIMRRVSIDQPWQLRNVPAMTNTRITILGLLLGIAIGVAGCSGSAKQILTTSSLTGAKPAASPQPVVVKPEDRAVHVAATSARAQKCGYYFDPVKLRESYLASEAQAGAQPAELARLGQIYDVISAKLIKALATQDNYCSGAHITAIKASLTRQLAGDFTPPKKKTKVASGGWFDWGEPEAKNEVFNPEWVNDPTRASQTKPAEEE